MLRLRSCISARLLSPASAASSFSVSSLHRRLSTTTAAPPISSPNPAFAVVDYLVAACGLTRPQALKASSELSHLKSPSNPDTVLAFLRGLGVSPADVIAKDPKFLCASVEKLLSPIVVELTDLGLSRPEIARLVPVALGRFRSRSVCRNLRFFLPVFGSFERLLQALKINYCLLSSDLERVIKPNIETLRKCGPAGCDMAKTYVHAAPRLLTANPERLQTIVAWTEGLGVPRDSAMFRHVLNVVPFLREERVAAKLEYLKKMFGWSDAQVAIAVSKLPVLLTGSDAKLQRMSEYLISQVGLDPEYIAHRPALVNYSLEGRHRPRYYVMELLRTSDESLGRDYFTALTLSNKVFVERFIRPHKEVMPHLAQLYAAACRGEVPII